MTTTTTKKIPLFILGAMIIGYAMYHTVYLEGMLWDFIIFLTGVCSLFFAGLFSKGATNKACLAAFAITIPINYFLYFGMLEYYGGYSYLLSWAGVWAGLIAYFYFHYRLPLWFSIERRINKVAEDKTGVTANVMQRAAAFAKVNRQPSNMVHVFQRYIVYTMFVELAFAIIYTVGGIALGVPFYGGSITMGLAEYGITGIYEASGYALMALQIWFSMVLVTRTVHDMRFPDAYGMGKQLRYRKDGEFVKAS